jgi:ATP-binding cassette subfamily B protein
MVGVFRYSREAWRLVWQTSPSLALSLAALTLVNGLIPPAMAVVGKWIVDAVVAAASGPHDAGAALRWVTLEFGLVACLVGVERAKDVCQQLLRAQLGHRVNVMILEKALELDLEHFEDPAFYDTMTQARRQASTRPLSLVQRTFTLVERAIALVSFGVLLVSYSPVVALVLVVAAIPGFIVETRFSGEAFRLFQWRAPETRKQMYLETVLAREDHAKEVQLLDIGRLLLGRYVGIFDKVYADDRSLALRRGAWSALLGWTSSGAFYAAYGWIAVQAARGAVSLGDMTMYLVVFRQAQAALSSSLGTIGGMVEDNLYLSTLYTFLGRPTRRRLGSAVVGALPGDGLRLEGVGFRYPGSERVALSGVNLHLRPGHKLALVGENGSGKTTLVKLVTRLYEPTEGRILLDGTDLADWDVLALRRRFAVLFQDFVRYQLLVGENIGVGDVARADDEQRWRDAAELGLASPVIDALPKGFHTQLGKWFDEGQELSVGQWQKVALARMFMRSSADILVLDEPTAAMDAEAEAKVFEQLRALGPTTMAIVISHRFSTVRMADRILVLHDGRVVEQGSHESLMRDDGRYAHLFRLQAAGYLGDRIGG